MTAQNYQPLYHLRALPDGSLYDLLAAAPDKHAETVRDLLAERGIDPAIIEREVDRRQSDKQARSCAKSRLTRTLFLLFSLIVLWFNIQAGVQLYQTDSPYRTFLIIFVIMTVAFGFYLGLKFNMYLYLGDIHRVYCGFPVPVGFVDAATAEEVLPPKPRFFLSLLVNGLASVNLTLLIPMLTVFSLI